MVSSNTKSSVPGDAGLTVASGRPFFSALWTSVGISVSSFDESIQSFAFLSLEGWVQRLLTTDCLLPVLYGAVSIRTLGFPSFSNVSLQILPDDPLEHHWYLFSCPYFIYNFINLGFLSLSVGLGTGVLIFIFLRTNSVLLILHKVLFSLHIINLCPNPCFLLAKVLSLFVCFVFFFLLGPFDVLLEYISLMLTTKALRASTFPL